jgi:hypothetical protein
MTKYVIVKFYVLSLLLFSVQGLIVAVVTDVATLSVVAYKFISMFNNSTRTGPRNDESFYFPLISMYWQLSILLTLPNLLTAGSS